MIKLEDWLKALEHTTHLWGFSPVIDRLKKINKRCWGFVGVESVYSRIGDGNIFDMEQIGLFEGMYSLK